MTKRVYRAIKLAYVCQFEGHQKHLYLISFVEILTFSTVFGYGEHFLSVFRKSWKFLKKLIFLGSIHGVQKINFFKNFQLFLKNYQKMFAIAKNGGKCRNFDERSQIKVFLEALDFNENAIFGIKTPGSRHSPFVRF